jgi:DNA-binding response OmpR family regulator
MQKILVVEDYRELSKFLAVALTGNDRYEVIATENGSAALSLLEVAHPDLALIDVRIPGVPGIDVSSRALALGVPVVLMTGDFSVSHQLAANNVPHLIKPFHVSELFAAVEREIARSEENRRVLRRSLVRLSAAKQALAMAHREAARTLEQVRRDREARQAKERAAPPMDKGGKL